MPNKADIVIIGGGIIGSAAAYFIASDPNFSGHLCVVEKDSTYQACSTALSAASIRQQFSTPENIYISQYGIDFLRHVGEHLAVDDGSTGGAVDSAATDIGLQERGYLLLATPPGRDILGRNHTLQRELDADIAWLEPQELQARYPWMNVEDIAAGTLGLSGEGWFDAYSLLQLFRAKNKSLGVTYLNDQVVGLQRDGSRITAAQLQSGETIQGGHFINAAGPQAAQIAGYAGLSLPVESRKRCVFVFHCREELPNCPMVIDPSGAYFRPEGTNFICGISPAADEDPECCDFTVDYGLFDEVLWPTLAHRVPAFESIKQLNAWAGHYAYNTLDQNVILGSHPDVANLYFANGFSGHGLQQAPAVGRALSELIVHGHYTTLDLSVFGVERVIEGRAVKELNVI